MIGRRAGVALAALLALAGCREGPAPTRPLVVTTIFPLWDLTRHVAGDRAEAQALVPPGVEPHDWEPSAFSRVAEALRSGDPLRLFLEPR